jgi:branched-chain amino acid transport system permease protein
MIGSYGLSVITLVGINVILALGLNLITGFCGQISLGHAAFYGVGAYATALLAKAGYPIWIALPFSMLAAAAAGLLVGLCSLRVREDFLAIATMAAGFIFVGVVKQNDALGGEVGISGIPMPGFGQAGFAIFVVAAMLLVMLFCLHVRRSWLGFAFSAVAADDGAAQLIGIDNRTFKLAAFCMGTALAGLSGSLLAYYLRAVSADAFGFVTSISILSMVVLGGMGSVFGCVIASAMLTVMPDVLRFADDYKLLIFGLLLFAVMRFAPDGLAGLTNLWPPRERRA